MNTIPLMLVLALAVMGVGVTGCVDSPSALIFSNLSLAPGATGVVTLSAAAIPRLSSIQIGPKGAVVFDPSVIEVVSVTGTNGFVVFSSQIDNALGEITLAAGSTSGPVPNGAILEFQVKALGPSGTSTTINASKVDFLLKGNSEPIAAFKVTPGKISIN